VLARHLSALALACGAFLAFAVPASAQTQQADAVLLARTLADGLTAVDARRPQARATVEAWLAEQGSCAKPHLPRARRSQFTYLRRQALHDVALRALAPELAQFTARLRALPVTDTAIRGGIREVLGDYRNARALMKIEPPSLCAIVRGVRGRGPMPWDLVFSEEDVRPSEQALDRRAQRLFAAQHALLAVEVDPRLARSLDTVFEHMTAGLYRSRLNVRAPFAPPFPIVTDAAGLARLRAEAASVAAATEPYRRAAAGIDRRLETALRRISRCEPAFTEAAKRRPNGLFSLVTGWLFGELAAAMKHPTEQFLAGVAAVPVSDQAMRDLLARTSDELAFVAVTPRLNLCSKLRAWRRAGWKPGAIDLGRFAIDITDGESFSGIRLEDEVIDRAVLRRRGVPKNAARVLLAPLDLLFETEQAGSGRPASTGYVASTQTLAARLRTMSAAVIARGAWRRPQATRAPATGRAGAR
jgi:hypothetical protein